MSTKNILLDLLTLRTDGHNRTLTLLPALVPEMTYEGMEVADGQAAGLAWESLVRDGLDRDERERISEALLDYCGQDALGMVQLVEKLQHESV